MTGNPLIRAGFLSGLYDYVRGLGFSLDPVLDSVGLELEQIQNPNHFIPLEKEVGLLDGAARYVGRDALMLELAQRQDLAIFGAIGALAVGSDTVASGLEVFQRYLHYGIQDVHLSLEVKGDAALFMVSTDFAPAMQSEQFWNHGVALMCQITRILLGQRWSPRVTYLDRPAPPDLEPYKEFFRSPLAFGQGLNGITLTREVLDAPVSDSLSVIPDQLRRYLNENYSTGFTDQVRRVIGSLLITNRCTAATVASAMGYAQRTLQRKLRARGTSFQEQLDQVRSSLAINYLREPQFRLADVSELLGYADQSVFSRSFRRWFKLTPQQWRARD